MTKFRKYFAAWFVDPHKRLGVIQASVPTMKSFDGLRLCTTTMVVLDGEAEARRPQDFLCFGCHSIDYLAKIAQYGVNRLSTFPEAQKD